MWKKCKPYVLSCLISLGVGGLAALLTAKDMKLFEEINLPPLAPPAWLFPIVWTVLYILMGISAARIKQNFAAPPRLVKEALTAYAMSLILNFVWPILFFSYRAFVPAFLWLLLLFAAVIRTFVLFLKIDKPAAYLQIPYLVWLTVAGYLSLGVAVLN